MDATNDATLSQDERTAALREAIRGEAFPEWVPESNNHIPTCYSFSPYTPTHAARDCGGWAPSTTTPSPPHRR